MVSAQLGFEYKMAQDIAQLKQQVAALATTPVLLNASTGLDGGLGLTTDVNGLHAYNSSGVQVNTIQTSDGTLVTFDASGHPVARFGVLLSNPGHYGGEIWDPINSVWVQLVTGSSVSWASITGKPSTFPPSAHTHAGGDITSAVADAAGSSGAYSNNVGGTSFYAVWVGNNAGNTLGKNTSSIRYKKNVRAHMIDPAQVLKMQPVIFDRIDGRTSNEYGMIAEQVNEHVPEIVQWYEGDIDGLRYDLLPVAQQSVLVDHDARIASLESQLAAALDRITALEAKAGVIPPAQTPVPPTPPPVWVANIPSYAAPPVQPVPLPYVIN